MKIGTVLGVFMGTRQTLLQASAPQRFLKHLNSTSKLLAACMPICRVEQGKMYI